MTGLKSGLELLEEVKVAIATAFEVDSFYDIDVFKRRDAISKAMETEIVPEFLGYKIHAELMPNGGDEYSWFIRSLAPHCDVVVSA